MKALPTYKPGDVVYSLVFEDGFLARAYSQLGKYGLGGDVFKTGDAGPWLVVGIVEKPRLPTDDCSSWFAYVLGRQFVGWVPVLSLRNENVFRAC